MTQHFKTHIQYDPAFQLDSNSQGNNLYLTSEELVLHHIDHTWYSYRKEIARNLYFCGYVGEKMAIPKKCKNIDSIAIMQVIYCISIYIFQILFEYLHEQQ